MSAEHTLPPLWRAALEVSLGIDGVDGAVAASGVIYDREVGERFPRRGNVNDAQIYLQALVRASLLVARITGHTATPQLFESLAKGLGVDLAAARYEEVADLVGQGLGPHEMRDMAELMASIYADAADEANRNARST